MSYKPMKIAVLSLSGNVGKTTLALHCLAAHRPEAKYISVETLNNTEASSVESIKVEELKASQFREIYRELMVNDDVIVDVGASNVEQFMQELTKYRSAIGEIDLVVVPTVPADKQQKDTIATIEWLHSLGMAPNKIRVVFNMYTGADTIGQTYAHVIGYSGDDGKNKATWMPHVVVETNDVFEQVKATRRTIREVANDPTDWKAARVAAKEVKDYEALERAMEGQMAYDLAVTASANLEKAVEDLFAPFAGKGSKK
jgi:MinD-like ATPase involved in chromosome partitioning or flagellar assembly